MSLTHHLNSEWGMCPWCCPQLNVRGFQPQSRETLPHRIHLYASLVFCEYRLISGDHPLTVGLGLDLWNSRYYDPCSLRGSKAGWLFFCSSPHLADQEEVSPGWVQLPLGSSKHLISSWASLAMDPHERILNAESHTEYGVRINQRTQTEVWTKTATSLGSFKTACIKKRKSSPNFLPVPGTTHKMEKKQDWLCQSGIYKT